MAFSTTLITGGFLSSLGVLLLLAGLGVHFALPAVTYMEAEKMCPLKDNDSKLYQVWADHGGGGAPIYQSFYLMNYTNHEAYLRGEETPRFEQVGPFTYRLFNWKESVQFEPEEGTVSFKYHQYFVQVKERQPGGTSLDDHIIAPNYALQGVLWQAKQLGVLPFVKGLIRQRMASSCLDKASDECEGLFLKRTIKEYLWGFNDPILEMIAEFVPQLLPNGSPFIGQMAIDTPAFYQNRSRQYTGEKDYKKTFVYTDWSGYSNLSAWWPEGAKGHDGFGLATDGWQFMPNPGDSLELFVDFFTTIMDIKHNGEKSSYLGVHTNTYYLDEDMFRRESSYGKSHYNYAPCDGLLNISSVKQASVFLSKPYFLDAQPCFGEMVQLPTPPNRDLHDTSIRIEPITGSSVAGWLRFQVNLEMQPWLCELKGGKSPVPEDCNLTTAFLPMMWTEQEGLVPPNKADYLKSEVYGLPKLAGTTAYVALGLSVPLVVWGYLLIRQHRQHRMAISLLMEDEPETTEFSSARERVPGRCKFLCGYLRRDKPRYSSIE